MIFNDAVQVAFYIAVLVALTKPLGIFMYRAIEGQPTFLTPALGWLEQLAYRVAGVDENEDMNWREYAKALLWFNLLCFLAVLLLQLFQQVLPLNPQALPNVNWHSAINTAVSFITNTIRTFAALAGPGCRSRRAGCGAELWGLSGCHYHGRGQTIDPAWAGRLANRHQANRIEWRRLF
jgi:hypothetical protein